MKTLDLEKTVFELTEEYPELIDIMAGLGFSEIAKKAMRHSVGKLTTISKGAKMKKLQNWKASRGIRCILSAEKTAP